MGYREEADLGKMMMGVKGRTTEFLIDTLLAGLVTIFKGW